MEQWVDIDGYVGCYQVSNYGKVRSLDRKVSNGAQLKGKMLTPATDRYGYKFIGLCRANQRKQVLVHRLVANAFLDKVNGNVEVNHIDGNKINNHVSNLEWCTKSENQIHAFHVIKTQHAMRNNVKLDQSSVNEIRALYAKGALQRELAERFHISRTQIGRIVRNESWPR